MTHRPNRNFCTLAGLEHPAPEALWHPREFTFERLQEILKTYVSERYFFSSFDSAARVYPGHSYTDLKNASIVVPVCFSPSNAVAIARLISDTAEKTQQSLTMRGTFYFEGESPAYRLDDPRTKAAIAEIHNDGHQIGMMLGITSKSTAVSVEEELISSMRVIMGVTGNAINSVTFRTVGVTPERVQAIRSEIQPFLERLGIRTTHDDFVTHPNVGLVTTSNGIYKNGHPLDVLKDGKQLIILNLIECWFSRDPKWQLDRLGSLPEVDAHALAVRRDYLGHVKVPILGQLATTEVVPEFAHWRGQRGFRDGLRLQASG